MNPTLSQLASDLALVSAEIELLKGELQNNSDNTSVFLVRRELDAKVDIKIALEAEINRIVRGNA